MKLTILFGGKNITEEGQDLTDILGKIGTNTESIIVLKGGKVVLEEEVSDGDTIELVNVASGG
jgi:sulfur carrier protein ThiS